MNYQEFIRSIDGNNEDGNGGTPVIERPPVLDNQKDDETEKPKDWNVIIHNDDHTPFNVVVEVLATVFNLDHHRSTQIMMAAHKTGKAVVATMSRDMAETKATQAMEMARKEINPVTRMECSLLFSTEEA